MFDRLINLCRGRLAGPLRVNFTVFPNFCFLPDCTFHWSFGDGTTGGRAQMTHVYGARGVYTATATVQTGKIKDSCSLKVAVQ